MAATYPEGVSEGVPIRVRYVGDYYKVYLRKGEERFAVPEGGMYRIYDVDDGEDYLYDAGYFEVVDVYGAPRGGVTVELDDEQGALLARLGLPTQLDAGMDEDAWCDILELLQDEAQMRGIKDAMDGQNAYGLLCTSVCFAMLDAEEAQEAIDRGDLG